MRHGILSGLLVAGLIAGVSAQANAQSASGGVEASTGTFNIAVGLKWSPLRYTHPIGSHGGAPTDGVQGTDDCGAGSGGRTECLYGWQTTSLDNYIGFFFHPQVGILLGLDMGYGSFHGEQQTAQGPAGMPHDVSYFQFGFSLGGKFYLTRPTGLRVSPYLYVDIFKYFVSINDNAIQGNTDGISAQAGLHAPFGGDLAFGAEYFFTNSFSLGAEVLGLRFAYVEGDWQPNANLHVWEKDWYFTFYTAITLNYRFLASASVRLEADVEADDQGTQRRPPPRRPKPRRVQPTDEPPPEAPPPSPESVD
jgi:hypothetical protein